MANPHRGEVTLDTSERTYKLSFSVNALCELEDALGKSVMEVVDELNATSDGPARISMKTLRVLIWAALIDHLAEALVDVWDRLQLPKSRQQLAAE